MKQFNKSLKLLILSIFAISIFVSPKQVFAASLTDIFTSPNSVVVKVQEQIEYFFAFKAEQKINVLDKQAERRLARAKNLVQTGDINNILSSIKSYKTIKEKQGNLIKVTPTTVLTQVKESTIDQQARIENFKKDLSDEAKKEIGETQIAVIQTVVENIKTKEPGNIEEVTEFVKKLKNVIDPGSIEVLEFAREIAPGAFEVIPGTQEVTPGSLEQSGGKIENAPGGIDTGIKEMKQESQVVD